MRHLLPLAAVPLAVALAGCVQFKQQAGHAVTGESVATESEPAWAPWPEAIAVHPATRVRAEGRQWIVDARVRMVDGLGDYTKASGAWHFELHVVGSLTENRYDLVSLWNEEVRSFDQHQAHFDAATRAYRFSLALAQAPPEGKPLRFLAVFTPDGSTRRMAAEFDLGGAGK